MSRDLVILVNEDDVPMGQSEKLEAHQLGLMHRAFSVFIFNNSGEMLLQRRALGKYHSGGLWTNACCSHPRPGETTKHAAERRLYEELGFTTEVQKIFEFTYSAAFANGLIENEYDHVFTGVYEAAIHPVPAEVMDVEWRSLQWITEDLATKPDNYTAWFHIALPKIVDWAEGHLLSTLDSKRA
ncbi:MAG TPA: isopentenyl-diphosphate Delta-isomerase [Flavitalea sp.]|nr:isopentenyl-diphosphate Delta-isomerase [Flavitalea sp.]